MPPVLKLEDQPVLVPTANYPHAKWTKFDTFNPIQSRVFEHYHEDTSALIAAATSSGKSLVAEQFLAHEVRARGGKGLYLAPLRALAQEKIDDWTDPDYHFNDLKISICTGDYRLTKQRRKELNDANLIIMTSEMLNHLARHAGSEDNAFLREIKTLVVDECFPANSRVRIANNIELPIGRIVNDDSINSVLAYDEKEGKVVSKKILRKIRKPAKCNLVSVTHEFGKFVCTEDHKIWTDSGYVRAIDLKSSHILKWIPLESNLICSQCGKVVSVRRWGRAGIKEVYDLEVEDCHNYFVNGTLVSNCHLLTMPGRGDHLEVGLMKFTDLNPTCRLVLLSATMPNVEEVAEWVSYVLTGRQTFMLQSDFRPCQLNLHYEKYWDFGSYDDNEQEKVNLAMDIVEHYPDDKFIVFVHTKRTGEMMKKKLIESGIEAEFHNANLEKAERIKFEKRFRTSTLRVVVATSTLEMGINMPARRVIILGVHRGLEEVPSSSIRQAAGRSGRVGLDPVGDAYILLPESTEKAHKARLSKPEPIQSQLLTQVNGKYKTLAFHLVNEIHHEAVQTTEDVHHWCRRSLAAFQAKELESEVLDNTLKLLKNCGAIYIDDEGKYQVTSVGKISSLFYFSPFDISDLRRNFNDLFDKHQEHDDYALSIALGNLDSHRAGIVSKAERDEMAAYQGKILKQFGGGKFMDQAIKIGYCYHALLNGHNGILLAGMMRNLKLDFERVDQVLIALDGMGAKWGRQSFLRQVGQRIQKGVKPELLDLCRLEGIGKVRAQRLFDAGIKTAPDLLKCENAKLRAILNLRADKVDGLLLEAQTLKS